MVDQKFSTPNELLWCRRAWRSVMLDGRSPYDYWYTILEPHDPRWRVIGICARCCETKKDHAEGTKCLTLPTEFELFRGEGFR